MSDCEITKPLSCPLCDSVDVELGYRGDWTKDQCNFNHEPIILISCNKCCIELNTITVWEDIGVSRIDGLIQKWNMSQRDRISAEPHRKIEERLFEILIDVIEDIGKNGYNKSIRVSKIIKDIFPASV